MRVVALEMMEALEPFWPRLIGSVASGHIRNGSDIDLHVFTDDIEELETWLRERGFSYELREVAIRKGGTIKDFLHIVVDEEVPIELSVYERREIRIRGPVVQLFSARRLTPPCMLNGQPGRTQWRCASFFATTPMMQGWSWSCERGCRWVAASVRAGPVPVPPWWRSRCTRRRTA